MAGKGVPSPLLATKHQLILGDDEFVAQHRNSKAHRRSLALPLVDYQRTFPDRDKAMAHAYRSGAYTMTQIAEHFGVHYMTFSRAVRAFERQGE